MRSSAASEVAMDSSPAVKFGCCLRPCGNHVSCCAQPRASLPAEKRKEIHWTAFISFSHWDREKSICRAVFPSKFFLLKREVGGRQYISEDVLIVSEELDSRRTVTLASTTNSVATNTLKRGEEGEESLEYSLLLKRCQDQCRGKKDRYNVNHMCYCYDLSKSVEQ